MTHEIHLTADEVAEACRQYAKAAGQWPTDDVNSYAVTFDIEAARESQDIRDNAAASFRGATVRMGGAK